MAGVESREINNARPLIDGSAQIVAHRRRYINPPFSGRAVVEVMASLIADESSMGSGLTMATKVSKELARSREEYESFTDRVK